MNRTVLIVLAAATMGLCAQAQAALDLPDRGRVAVVDAADVIPAAEEAALNARIYEWVEHTGHQLVVATVPTLSGSDIKNYGYQLGRAWGLGDKARNDGVILLLAPSERKVRIEVGYGLEPVLTDAVSSEILRTVVTPKLKAGDIAGALADGADRIMQASHTPSLEPAAVVHTNRHVGTWLIAIAGVIAGLAAIAWLLSRRTRDRRERDAEQLRAAAPRSSPRETTIARTDDVIRMSPRRAPAGRSSSPTAPPSPIAYVAPVYESYSPPTPSPSPSPSYDFGSSSGFDSGGGSFGGGGADSSY